MVFLFRFQLTIKIKKADTTPVSNSFKNINIYWFCS